MPLALTLNTSSFCFTILHKLNNSNKAFLQTNNIRLNMFNARIWIKKNRFGRQNVALKKVKFTIYTIVIILNRLEQFELLRKFI